MNFTRLSILLPFLLLFTDVAVLAQDPPKEGDKNEEQEEKRKLTRKEKKMLAYQEYVETVNRVSKMSREKKNTMTSCPLHHPNKKMPISDNYRPDASDYTTCFEYPFAYQLNYRRYCRVCTRIMSKDYGEKMPMKAKASFERCGIHNKPLLGNPDYSGLMQKDDPNDYTPHARQYKFKYYCKVCTRVVRKQNK